MNPFLEADTERFGEDEAVRMRATEHIQARSDPYWVGRLSMSIAQALPRLERSDARDDLRLTLDSFLRSPLPSDELRALLGEHR